MPNSGLFTEVHRLRREARKRNGRQLGPPVCVGNARWCGKPVPDADPEDITTWLCDDCKLSRGARRMV